MIRATARRVARQQLAWAWLARAWTSLAAGRVGRSRTWTARGAYALARAGRVRAAVDTYIEVIALGPTVADVTEHIATNPAGHGIPRGWLYGLGTCLYRLGDTHSAATLLRAACRADAPRKWRLRLADVLKRTGDVPAAIAVLESLYQQNPEIGGIARRLAELYDTAGRWDDAEDVLAVSAVRLPRQARNLLLRAAVATSRALWGGTIRPGADASFDFAPDRSAVNTARDSLEEALTLRPADARWRAQLADARAAAGDLDGAISAYQQAVHAAEHTTERWALGSKQRWQFHLERCHARRGTPRVADPLFQASAEPAGEQVTGAQQVPGLFTAQFGYAGLTISGFLLVPTSADHVIVRLDDAVLRSVNVNRDSYLPQFTLLIKRAALDRFPPSAILRVLTPDGEPLRAPHGYAHIELSVPHGDGSALGILNGGATLTKKGELALSAAEARSRQDRDLEIYSRVRDFFEEHLGRSIFLLYGSLLGYYRDGDLIPGDDDFDAGFVCDADDPVGAKQEAKDVVVALIRAGFTVSFNRRGRLFRVQLDRAGRDHIDVHPVWFQDGNAWIHNVACLPITREEFLPAATGELRGVTVSTPHTPEAFLRENYGAGWKVPDPGFRYYPSALAPNVRRNLTKALLTVGEYKELARRVERETAGSATAGRLVSIGSQDLYPLEQFIA